MKRFTLKLLLRMTYQRTNNLWVVIVCLLVSLSAQAQNEDYRGTFGADYSGGMRTDHYFNLYPRTDATTSNTWNIYHLDGSTILNTGICATSPYFYFGQGKATNVYINGNVGIGTSSPTHMLQVAGTLGIRADNSAFVIDDQYEARLGFVKQSGSAPQITTGVASSMIFSQSSEVDVTANISTATLTERMRINTDGNVGIGSSAPEQRLTLSTETSTWQLGLTNGATGGGTWQLGSSADDWDAGAGKFLIASGTDTEDVSLAITEDQYVGLGTVDPQSKLHVVGDVVVDDEKPRIFTGSAVAELDRYLHILNTPSHRTASGVKAGGVLVSDDYDYANPDKNNLIVKGAVGIGTPLDNNPNDYSLAVNGKIGAHDIRVENSSATWPDYVFETNYVLTPLESLEAYLRKNKHLPDVPTAATVAEEGYSVDEMTSVLLKKVEELTLYVIELKKENEAMKKALEEIKNKE